VRSRSSTRPCTCCTQAGVKGEENLELMRAPSPERSRSRGGTVRYEGTGTTRRHTRHTPNHVKKSVHAPAQLPNCKASTTKTSPFPPASHNRVSGSEQPRSQKKNHHKTKKTKERTTHPGRPLGKLGDPIMHHAERAHDEEGPGARGAEVCCEGDRLEGL
jgi:hypothetical protein